MCVCVFFCQQAGRQGTRCRKVSVAGAAKGTGSEEKHRTGHNKGQKGYKIAPSSLLCI